VFRDPAIRLRHVVILALVLCAAVAVRWYRIGSASFWTDEFLSLEVSTGHGYDRLNLPRGVILDSPASVTDLRNAGSWSQMLASLHGSTHPPLYFIVLRLWRELLHSDSDTAVRSLSAVLSVLAVLLAFDAARLLHGTTTALWAAAVLALANPQIEFAQEARGYAMLVALMLACCDAIARIERLGPSRRRLLALGLCAAAMLLTHYLAFAIVAALAIYAALRLSAASRRATLIAFAASTSFVLIVWGPMMWSQSHRFSQNLGWMYEPRDGHVWHTLDRLAGLPLRLFFNPGLHPGPVVYGGAVLFVLPALLMRRRPDLLLWYLLFVALVLVVTLGDLVRSTVALGIPRYTIAAAAAANVLVAVLATSVRGRWRHLVPMVPVLGCALALPLAYERDKPDWRAAAQYLDRDCRTDSTIVFFPKDGADWYAGMLEVGVSHYAGAASGRPIVILQQPADARLLRDLAARGGTIDVISGSAPPGKILPGCIVRSQALFPFIGSCARVQVPPAAVTAAADHAMVR
jgi:uncharacterized membrane protein